MHTFDGTHPSHKAIGQEMSLQLMYVLWPHPESLVAEEVEGIANDQALQYSIPYELQSLVVPEPKGALTVTELFVGEGLHQ